MRCDCCDAILTPFEGTIKHSVTGEYLNTCLRCLDGLGIPWEGNAKTQADEKKCLTESE